MCKLSTDGDREDDLDFVFVRHYGTTEQLPLSSSIHPQHCCKNIFNSMTYPTRIHQKDPVTLRIIVITT